MSLSLTCTPKGLAANRLRMGGLSEAEIEEIVNRLDFSYDFSSIQNAIVEALVNRDARVKMLIAIGYKNDLAEELAKLFGGDVKLEWLYSLTFHRDKNKELRTSIFVFAISLLAFLLFLILPFPEILGGVLGLVSLAATISGIFLMYDNISNRKKISAYPYHVIERYISQKVDSAQIDTH